MSAQPDIAKICAVFGCTPEQARAQLARNAIDLQGQAAEARKRGGKYRGFTEEYLTERARAYAKAVQS